ncbi:MAG: peptide MFS transporter [Bacteroidales bacterium]
MFRNQPKGLIPAALANMGERFGFYTMMAILTLFLMSKFNMTGEEAGSLYSIFYGAIYILALAGGFIADRTKKYKSTIIAGLVTMTLGYVLLTMPSLITSKYIALAALLVIAFGNGLFKGNLQAVVGQLYDNEKYGKLRDSGFQIFYMFINIGGMFAPFAATSVRNWFVKSQGFLYHQDLPALCHQLKDGKMSEEVLNGRFSELATQVSGGTLPADLSAFADQYLNAFNTGFHYAFSVAIFAMLISLAIFLIFQRQLPNPAAKQVVKADDGSIITKEEIKQDAQEIRQRILALLAVFGVVIFFWFSFHQNGLTLTMFARDYTDLSGIKINLGFVTIQGAEIFQSINPFFIVFLTPIIMAIFGWLRARGKEPSTPKKIAIGMGIAAIAYVVMAIGSYDLPLFKDIQSSPLDNALKVTPFLLIGTYFILTVAELFISPLGISFVSKVAPPHLQGLMQGGWLGATAIGNQLLFIGAILYESTPLWLTWTVFVVACLLSMITMLAMLKWLERITK